MSQFTGVTYKRNSVRLLVHRQAFYLINTIQHNTYKRQNRPQQSPFNAHNFQRELKSTQNLQNVRPRGVGCPKYRLPHTRSGQGHQHAVGKGLHNLRRATNDPRIANRLPGSWRHQGHPVNAVLCLCQPPDDTPAEDLLQCTWPDKSHSIDAVLCLRHGSEVELMTQQYCSASGSLARFSNLILKRQPCLERQALVRGVDSLSAVIR